MANPQSPFQERFIFGGINLNNPPDALPPNKFAAALNIRSNSSTATSIYTRPGSTQAFIGNNNAITDIRAFATLLTDDNPRVLARDTLNRIYLDNGNLQTTLGSNGFGVRMIPFRPGASPQSYMYVYANNNAAKISAPDANNNCVITNIGIAEPQSQTEFAPAAPMFTNFTLGASNWVSAGTGGNVSNNTRSADVIGAKVADPVQTTRYSIHANNNGPYQVGELLNFFDSGNNNLGTGIVQLVLAPIAAGNVLTAQAIRYDNGSNGFCTIVPSQIPVQGETQIASLQRGSLLQINQGNNNEAVLVLSATPGPSGGVSIRTQTNNTYTAGANINGLSAIVVDTNNSNLGTANNMSSTMLGWAANNSNNNTTFATLTQTFGTNPFAVGLSGNNNVLPQEDDYIHFSILVDNPISITEIKLQFNVDANDNNFTANVLYYSVRQSDLAQVVSGAATTLTAIEAGANNTFQSAQAEAIQFQINTIRAQISVHVIDPTVGNSQIAALQQQLVNMQQFNVGPDQTTTGNNQWTEIMFPISSLTRIGNDLTKTLANCRQVQVWVNCNATTAFDISSIWVGGGSQPDTGNAGAAYQYQVVPRNQASGATGNPSPVPLYGMFTRRQAMKIVPPSFSYDSQIDVYDVYRYGGTVTSYRYIGTGIAGNNFTDNFTDASAEGGNEVLLDNFQPWPSVDVPFKVTGGGNNTISLIGTYVVVTLGGGATWPASTNNWLPGTLIQINQLSAYALWVRPVSLGNNSYLFKFNQTTGSGNATTFWVNEPLVANQPAPYTWGPDAAGTVFGTGDPFRPGSVYFTKGYAPDSAPDSYNLDLVPPSEPLMGGEIVSGISLCASTQRWWGLYPDFSGTDRYQATERNVGRGLLTPYGHTTDGLTIYFWARDGIYATSGEAGKCLTDDLFTLFPHDGRPGANVARNAVTFYAPDYSRAAQFRLVFSNGYLYAIYPDTGGTFRTMVLDLRTGAWSQDSYATPMSGGYAVEQQAGTITSANNSAYAILYMGLTNGAVNKQAANSNDNAGTNNSTGISCVFQTREWDGGQQVLNGLWRDVYIDAYAPNGYNVTPMSLGAPCGNTTAIAAALNRRLSQGPNDPGTVERFLGAQVSWTDNF